jgi:cell division protein FtsI (penicillin-binding protein 3)
MLLSVFDKGAFAGTAGNLVVPGFRCGGKTGTAHKYDPETKQYATDRYLSSFAGLAPIDHPQLAIVVMIDEPSGGDYFGGKVAGPVFATVASEALRYLGVPGDALPAVAPPPAAPSARVVPPPAPAPPPPPAPEPVIDPAATLVPDFAGMGVGHAVAVARELHLDLEIHGSGRVTSQEPPPGPAPGPVHLSLTFSDEPRGIPVVR